MPASQPPAAAPGALAVDRRRLLIGGLLGAGFAAAPLAAQVGRGFTHGVASGEPAAQSVLLWTRYVAGAPATLRYELSESADFARIAGGGTARAEPGRDWCAKAVATGLKPGTWYHYRFIAADGTMSDTGRTRTLPEGPTDRFRMAVFSCSNIGFGYFNGYAHAAEDGAFDLAVHLGDYFYEYNAETYPSPAQRLAGRFGAPYNETVALADYRLRYASYRRDPDLMRLHQLYPMVSVFDDHETANDSWKGGAENHDPASEGPWSARKAASMQARREWLPVSDEPWARYDIGDLATLFRLETRLTARDKPLDLGAVVKGLPEDRVGPALAAFRDGAWADPRRTLMGAAQERWLADGMRASTRAGRKWQVLAQQIVMGSLRLANASQLKLDPEVERQVGGRLAALTKASDAGLPFNMDAWDGYPAARKRLLDAARAADANLIVLSGDSHNAWACELDGAGVEFAGHSVTSPGAEAYLPFAKPADLARGMVSTNPQLKWCDTARRGYMAVELTPEKAACEWRFTGAPKTRSTRLAGTQRLATARGARRFTEGLSG